MSRTQRIALLVLILLPVTISLPSLTGIFNADPMLRDSGLGFGIQAGLLAGFPSIDPSIGVFHQALGHLAITDLLHGHMPFWNPYEMAGTPLLGEMNSSPFYPLMLLLLLPHGQVVMEVAIQILSGIATFALLRRLGLGVLPGLTGGLLFEFNGTMAWLGGGWNYAAPCLPLLILGIELLRSSLLRVRAAAVAVMAVAIAVSISAGFIEISYLNGLFCVAWALLRWLQAPRREIVVYAAGLGLATLTGILLAAPILIAFFDFLRVASAGLKHSGAFAGAHLPLAALLQKFFPYIGGPIFRYTGFPWGGTGGYLGFAPVIVAVSALVGSRDFGLRRLLGGWVILSLGSIAGVFPFLQIMGAIPGVRFTASYRYLDMSCEFAIAVLAAYGVDDVRVLGWDVMRRRMAAAGAIVAILCVACLPAAIGTIKTLIPQPGYYGWLEFSVLSAYLFGALVIVVSRAPTAGLRMLLLSGTLVIEALCSFVIPTAAAPLGGTLVLGGVDFLRAHLEYSRYYSLGALAPNYNAQFRIASIDYNDIPVATSWIDYVHRKLDPFADPLTFDGSLPRTSSDMPDQFAELAGHLADYENVGVKYVLTVSNVSLLGTVPSARPVYRDAVLNIFELPRVAPYMAAPGCTLTLLTRTEARGTCTAPATLRRLELYMPGWGAQVNGANADVTALDGTFQQVHVPAGSIDVRFSFVPPGMGLGYAGFALGMILLVGSVVGSRVARRTAT